MAQAKRRVRLYPIEGGRNRDARWTVTKALRSVRDEGAKTVVVVIARPDGSRDIYTSTSDSDIAIGLLHRATMALERDEYERSE